MRGPRRTSRLRSARLRHGALFLATALVTLGLGPGRERLAHADNCHSPFLSSCINDDNLWPHAGSSHFMTVGGTETTARGEVAFGLYTTYLSRPIVLQSNSGGQTVTDNVVDNQINGNFMFAYGVSDRLELDAVLPVTFSQSGTGESPITGAKTGLSTSGLRDLRFGLSYALVPRKRVDPEAFAYADVPRPSVWSLTARTEVSAPTGDTAGFGSDGYAVWSPSLAGDYRRGPWFAGAEVGLRLRKTEELEGARIGSQAFVGLGFGRDLVEHELLSLAVEAYVLPTFAEQHTITAPADAIGTVSTPNGNYIAPAEWMLSVRSAPLFGGDLQLQAGGGGSIPFSDSAALTNPRFRFALSVRFAPTNRDTDGDGVVDKEDKCPFVHGVIGNPAGEGCPASAQHEEVDLTGAPPPAAAPPVPTPEGAPAAASSAPPAPAPSPDPPPSASPPPLPPR